jgi:hypothetical protein
MRRPKSTVSKRGASGRVDAKRCKLKETDKSRQSEAKASMEAPESTQTQQSTGKGRPRLDTRVFEQAWEENELETQLAQDGLAPERQIPQCPIDREISKTLAELHREADRASKRPGTSGCMRAAGHLGMRTERLKPS